MKIFTEHCIDTLAKINYYINEANEFFDGNIPNDIKNDIKNKNYFGYLYENLMTHDINKLKEKLKSEYPYIEFDDYSNGSFYINIDTIEQYIKLKNDDKLKSLLCFYGYFISEFEVSRTKLSIYIEPFNPKEMTDYLYKECHGICYHICERNNTEKILNSGLRCKQAGYRYFPKRIFLYCTPNNIYNDEEFGKLILEITNPYVNYNVLRIDLNHFNFIVYKDPAMENKGAIFTYNNIPAKLIKKIDYKF